MIINAMFKINTPQIHSHSLGTDFFAYLLQKISLVCDKTVVKQYFKIIVTFFDVQFVGKCS